MRALITNDDGYGAKGLCWLVEACKRMNLDATVVAPASEQSGVGTARTLRTPLRVISAGDGYAVKGTPVDCVAWALSRWEFDMVLSGINRGENTGARTLVASGTAGAARYAKACGVPAVAFSQYYTAREHFESGGEVSIQRVIDFFNSPSSKVTCSPSGFLNVNFPDPSEKFRGHHMCYVSDAGLRGDFEEVGPGLFKWLQHKQESADGLSDTFLVAKGFTTVSLVPVER